VAEKKHIGSSAVSRDQKVNHDLEAIIADMAGSARFALPGPLCAPVFRISETAGPQQRVLLALLWLSSESLKRGEVVRFRVPLVDLTHSSGFSRYRSNVPVLEALSVLEAETCEFDDASIAVFSAVSVVKAGPVDVVEWVFTQEFSQLFFEPKRFALLGIREICGLKKGMDCLLYRQSVLVKNMRNPEFHLAGEDLYSVAGISPDLPFKRVMEAVRRSLVRVVPVVGSEIRITPILTRGTRSICGVSFRVG
jgi:hypothetical protein